MGLFDFLFGGTDTSSQDATLEANAQAIELIRQQGERARSDVLGIFPQAQQAQTQGFQGALDVLGQTIPQQANVFQQGFTGAQDVLKAGLASRNNAILGLPQDLSLSGVLGDPSGALNVDFGFANQQLPQSGQLGLPASGGTTPINTAGIPQDILNQLLQLSGQVSSSVPGQVNGQGFGQAGGQVPGQGFDTESIPAVDLKTTLDQVLDTVTVDLNDPNREALQAEAVRAFQSQSNITNQQIAEAFGTTVDVVNDFLR